MKKAAGIRPLSAGIPRLIITTLAGSLFVISTIYVSMLFVEVDHERQRTWSENSPPAWLYPATWDEPPLFGLFGFPHQAGWRAVSSLIPPDGLPYASNEEAEITNFYMRQAPRTHCQDFNTFMLVSNAQDEIPFEEDQLAGLHLQSQLITGGRISLEIYSRVQEGETAVFPVDDEVIWLTPEQVRPSNYRGANPVEINLANQVNLAGYDLERENLASGGIITIRLYWEVLAPFEQNKQVFVHLWDGDILAQDDSAPECAVNPTVRWEPGQIVVDPHVISLPATMPAGRVEVIVGMYDLLDGSRLPRHDGQGDSVLLTEISVP